MASISTYRITDQFFLDSYSGEGGYVDGNYLERFPRETDSNFQARQRLAVYPNYVKKVTDCFSGFLWQRPPNRETDDTYSRFAANCDGAGTALDLYLQIQQRLAMLLGTVYLIVDKPNIQAKTRAEDALPYLSARLPGEMTCCELDARGRVIRCAFSEVGDGQSQYRHFDADGWQVSKDPEGQDIIAQGTYSLKRPPIVRLHSTLPMRTTDHRALAWARDLAQLNWDLYNQCSEVRWLFRSQVFALLMLPASDQGERERLSGLTIGPNNALAYDPNGGGRPDYLAPPPDPVTAYQKNIADTIDRIYQLANLEFVGGTAPEAGVSLAFKFQNANRTLGVTAGLAEQAEREIADLVARWQGSEFKGNIAYSRDFNLTDLGEALSQAMESVQLDVSPTFDAEVKKRIARQVLGHGVPQATLQKIDGEIEAPGDPYGDRARKETGNLPPLGKTA